MNFEEIAMRVIAKATELLPAFLEEHAAQLGGRQGVYLEVLEPSHESLKSIGRVIGTLPNDKVAEKAFFAREKTTRIFMSIGTDNYACTSFKTQDYALKQYGGGIQTMALIAAVSGFPPHLDHKFIVQVVRACGGLMGDMEYKHIQNEFEQYKNQGVAA